MIDNEMLAQIEVSDEELNRELAAAFEGDTSNTAVLEKAIDGTVAEFKDESILKGKVVGRSGNEIIVDVGLKSEGYVPINEWDDPGEIDVGDEIEVLLEQIESETGTVVLSKRKADRIRGWERVMSSCREGDRVK